MSAVTPKEKQAMKDKFVLILGGTDGLGKATAIALAKQGATIVLVGRNAERGERAVAEVCSEGSTGEVFFLPGDMGEMVSVRQLAAAYRDRFSRLDVLLHCACTISMKRSHTSEGIETNFATNYLGRFLLTELLQDLIPQDTSRVIIVGTAGLQPIRFDFARLPACHELSMFRAYQQSQAANDVWGLDLADQLSPRGIAVSVVAPGIVKTKLRRRSGENWLIRFFDLLSTPFSLSIDTGILTLVYLASAHEAQSQNGMFFGARCKVLKIPVAARDWRFDRNCGERVNT